MKDQENLDKSKKKGERANGMWGKGISVQQTPTFAEKVG